MVAPRRTKKIFCTVVRVPAADDSIMRSSSNEFNTSPINNPRFSTRPSDLLPWADPYIARLVSKLQDEVRDERSQSRVEVRSTSSLHVELEPPCPTTEGDWESRDDNRWSTFYEEH